MTTKNPTLLLALCVPFFCFSVAAQDANVGDNRNGRSFPSGTINNSTPGSININNGKRATRTRENQGNAGIIGSAEGTGEYFLVPAIDRKNPVATANRMNTGGAAILSLLDKNALGGLTEDETQPLTRNTVLGIAESRFRMAIKFEPGNYLYHTNLASALYRQGKIDEALEAVSRAIELNPNDETSKNYLETILRVKVTVRVLDDVETEKQ